MSRLKKRLSSSKPSLNAFDPRIRICVTSATRNGAKEWLRAAECSAATRIKRISGWTASATAIWNRHANRTSVTMEKRTRRIYHVWRNYYCYDTRNYGARFPLPGNPGPPMTLSWGISSRMPPSCRSRSRRTAHCPAAANRRPPSTYSLSPWSSQ